MAGYAPPVVWNAPPPPSRSAKSTLVLVVVVIVGLAALGVIAIAYLATGSGGSPASNSNTVIIASAGSGWQITAGSYAVRSVVANEAGVIEGNFTLSSSGATPFVACYPCENLTIQVSASTVYPEVGQAVTFTSSVSGGVAPYTYSWNFDDGSAPVQTASATHTYAGVGTYRVELTVTDSAGNVATSAPLTVNVSPPVEFAGFNAYVMTQSEYGSFINHTGAIGYQCKASPAYAQGEELDCQVSAGPWYLVFYNTEAVTLSLSWATPCELVE